MKVYPFQPVSCILCHRLPPLFSFLPCKKDYISLNKKIIESVLAPFSLEAWWTKISSVSGDLIIYHMSNYYRLCLTLASIETDWRTKLVVQMVSKIFTDLSVVYLRLLPFFLSKVASLLKTITDFKTIFTRFCLANSQDL